MKLMLAVPAIRGEKLANPEHIRAKDEMVSEVGLERLWNVGVTEVHVQYLERCSLVPLARNSLAAIALARGMDLIFWADDDIWWRTEDVATAVWSGHPIVGFPCFSKPIEGSFGISLNHKVRNGDPVIEPDNDWQEVLACGTGAMLTRIEVFRTLKGSRPRFRHRSFERAIEAALNCPPLEPHLHDYFPTGVRDMNGERIYVGEDIGFCLAARDAGIVTRLHGRSVTAHMNPNNGVVCDFLEVRKSFARGDTKVNVL